MKAAAPIVAAARERGETSLSEYDSKRILAAAGFAVSRETLVRNLGQAKRAAREIGYPVVLKACAAGLAHKTELGLVAVNLAGPGALADAFSDIAGRAGKDFSGGFLVQEMVKAERELMMGMARDPQFGATVMFGLGGIFAEVMGDAAFRLAPLAAADAATMIEEIRGAGLLGAVRGLPPVDRRALTRGLVGLSRLAQRFPEIAEIDVNPLMCAGARPVAVDALVVLGKDAR